MKNVLFLPLTNIGEHHGHKSKSLSYERRKKNSREQHYDNKPLTEEEVMDLLNLMNYLNQDSKFMPEEYKLETVNPFKIHLHDSESERFILIFFLKSTY